MHRRLERFRNICQAATLAAALPFTAFAWTPHDSTNNWNVASGNASVAANFSPATAPGANTLVRVDNGGEMQIDSDMSWGALYAGYVNAGVVRQTSGTLTVNNAGNSSNDGTLVLGYNENKSGRYYLSGDRFYNAAGNPKIGRRGFGLLDISGGEFYSTMYPSVGAEQTGRGHVDVHGDGVLNTTSASQTLVGERGTGVITVRDGGKVKTGKIVLGSAASATGMVNVVSGGEFSPVSVVPGASGVKRINAVGGTVKPIGSIGVVTNYMDGVQMSVGAGGLVFDSNGRAVTLGASLSASRLSTANLAHRWSFNGNATDSVGGMNATTEGSGKSGITYANGEICIPGTEGNNHNQYISLGAGCIPSGKDGITVEMWVTHQACHAWSRIFTCRGDDDASMMFIAWTRTDSSVGNDYTYFKAAGTEKTVGGTFFRPWTLGEKFHVTFVFEKLDDCWRVDMCKRDALTGAPMGRYTTTVALEWDPADLAKRYFNLGYSNASDPSACANYDEVRIWNIALTEDELVESSTRGPNADFSSAPGLRKIGAGTLALSTAAGYAGATRVESGVLSVRTPETPVHRWRFENGSITDDVTGTAATKTGGSSSGIVATEDSKGLLFPGASHNSAYLNLGYGTIPTGANGFTLEIWATLLSLRTWERIFTIATDDFKDMCFMTWVGGSGTDNAKDYVGFKYNGSATNAGNYLAPYELNQPYHVVVTVLPKDGGWVVRFYKQNATTGELEKWYGWALPSGWTPARFAAARICLAWSSDGGNDDANARYDEVRVWNRAFTEDEIVTSGLLGPDELPPFWTAAVGAGSLPSTTDLIVENGTVFHLGGVSQTVASLSGAGTVWGQGVLTVSGMIRPGGASTVGTLVVNGGAALAGTVELDVQANGTCDSISFADGGTYDISGMRWTLADPSQMSADAKYTIASAGAATLTGEPDLSGLPANMTIVKKSGNLVLCRTKGLVIVFK